MKEKIERMKERIAEARKSLAIAESTSSRDEAVKNFERAQSLIGLVQLGIEQADFTKMDDRTYEQLQQISAAHASLTLRLENLRSNLRWW